MPAYVKLLVNDKQKKIAVQACDAKDENAIKFCKTKRSKADGVDSDAAGKASSVTVRTTDVLVAVQKYFRFTSYSQRWRVSEQYSAQLEKSHIVQFS